MTVPTSDLDSDHSDLRHIDFTIQEVFRDSYVGNGKRLVHWVWVSTSSMMFRRSLIDLVFPEDDETYRLHMDFYVVVMAQMVAGSTTSAP